MSKSKKNVPAPVVETIDPAIEAASNLNLPALIEAGAEAIELQQPVITTGEDGATGEQAPEGWVEIGEGTEQIVLSEADQALLDQLEQAENEGMQAPAEDQAEEEPMPKFDDLLDAVDEDTRRAVSLSILMGLDDRAAFEEAKNPDNDSIQKTLKKLNSALASPKAAAVIDVTSTPVDFMNQGGANRYNVYAIDKLADIVAGLSGGVMRNAINNAVTKSLFRFRAAGESFTGEMAKAAASDKIRIQGAIKAQLVRHTVSAQTAPTQASSTMQALQTLGIVVNKGSVKHPVYELTDTPQTAKLKEILAA
jgi:hypothetical protein